MGVRVIWFIGTLPPPVTGMNAASAMVLGAVRERLDQLQRGGRGRDDPGLKPSAWGDGVALRVDNASHPRWRGWRYKAWKLVRTAWALARLAVSRRGRVVLYLAANSRGGLWYDVAAAGIARLRGFEVVLHHHVYAYLGKRDRRMARICRWMGERGTHVALDAGMAGRLRWVYGAEISGSRVMCVPNGVPDDAPAAAEDAARSTATQRGDADRPLRLGHLSNLTAQKGLDLVIDTLAALRKRGESVELVLAGPCATRAAASLVASARERFGEVVDYRGPVYDQAKRDFWRSIDVFLFPTRYENEAQPLVILEALAHGVPVVAYARGCIGAMLSGGNNGSETGTADERPAGIALDVQADFVRRAARVIQGWSRDRQRLAASSAAARQRAAAWRIEADAALDELIAALL